MPQMYEVLMEQNKNSRDQSRAGRQIRLPVIAESEADAKDRARKERPAFFPLSARRVSATVYK